MNSTIGRHLALSLLAGLVKNNKPHKLASTKLCVMCALALQFLVGSGSVSAAVFDTTATDVTTRAAAVVWVSDEPILDISVRVFSDVGGLTEITNSLTITKISEQFTPAHSQGIAKIDIVGLVPSASVYIQTETTTGSSVSQFPATAPFMQITASAQSSKLNALNQPIVNDVISHDMFFPDGVTPAPGTLLMLEVPGVSRSPVTAFVGGGGVLAPQAIIDMNNIFNQASVSADVLSGQVLLLTEFRGLLCAGTSDHKLFHFRRAPVHTESPAITELETAANCFFANTVCSDNVVDASDIQVVLTKFNSAAGMCNFNPDFDVDGDGVIDATDSQSVLTQFNATAPF